jgi:small subunit ribosomal protein S4
MRYTGPKNRLSRREGIDLGLKTPGSKSQASLLRRLNIIPGQHGGARSRKKTDYGYQLREKQKMKRLYGITESKMSIYFATAKRITGNTADNLVQILERRLDNIVYRLGFAPTRAIAQLSMITPTNG